MGILHHVATLRQRGGRNPLPVKKSPTKSHTLPLFVLILLSCIVGCSIGSHIFSSKKEVRETPGTYGLRYQDVWFTSADGVQLNGWYIPGKPQVPPLLFFHGNGGNLSDNVPYVRLLHDRGFPIFIFDYRGFGKSRGKPLGENDLYNDARGALTFLSTMGWRYENTIFYGQSMGGAVALQMALEKQPRALVLESCFTTLSDIVKHLAPIPYYVLFWWCFDLGFDNVAKIQQNRVPVFVIHGTKDAVAPVEMGRRLYAKAQQPKMLYIVPNGRHCDAQEVEATSYLQAWSKFLGTLQTRTASRKLSKR
ncbi:alpha/beta hydrolase [Geomonas sp. RF6]|uniref:alpha/beta hydrolase n=1 Tax=Geomonas sp. RF6 TaxID=2897342 RepID=UPI001E42C77A|nr:alpha/beta hydrolase [Geomonas sp. RF6]UFS69379.1 alpha/beta hydrolase [Geomonas sp. RF6]